MEDKDFVQGFGGFSISYYFDNYVVSYAELLNQAATVAESFSFTLAAGAPSAYVGVEFYNPRMYPLLCHTFGINKASVKVTLNG